MRWLGGPLGGHLGSAVSALVDGQLDPASAERGWSHALCCPPCRAAVEREVWVKRSLATIGGVDPSPLLTEALQRLPGHDLDPWPTTAELERRSRLRRRGLLAAGAGTVSAAVLGLGTASGAFDPDPAAVWPGTETSIGGARQDAP